MINKFLLIKVIDMGIIFITFSSPIMEFFSSYYELPDAAFCSPALFLREAPKTLANDSYVPYDTAHAGIHNPLVASQETIIGY